nr:UDP-N-acetylglucosamine 2-epimerase (hydrolyzing) [Acidobacteriota bacterium]
MRNVCVVITARPSYSRVKSVLEALKSRSDVNLQIVVAASALVERTGRVVEIIRRDGFSVDAEVSSLVEGDTGGNMARSTALALLELPSVFARLQPDVVLTIADRYETIATAIAASYMRIPVAHLQGGEVTGNIDERVRHANTKLSDLHFVASEVSRRRVLAMGEYPDNVFLTGCPSIDLARNISPETPMGFDPFKKYGGVGELPIDLNRFMVVLQHPVTNEIENSRSQVVSTLEAAVAINLPTLWFWPNVDAGSDQTSKAIRSFRETRLPKNIHFFKNMEPSEFLQLINRASVLVGNSSVGVREAGYLGVPVVNIGTRQLGRERSKNVVDCGYGTDEIRDAIERQISHGRYSPDHLYGDGTAGARIASLLATIHLSSNKRFFDTRH